MGDRRHVVGKQKALLFGCPFKNYGVACTGKADILDADNVDIRPATEQAANDIIIEILVGGQEQHSNSQLCGSLTRQQTLPHADRIGSGFIESADLLSFPTSLMKIDSYFILVPQVVAYNRVDVGQRDRWVLLGYLFGRRAVVESLHDSIGKDPLK